MNPLRITGARVGLSTLRSPVASAVEPNEPATEDPCREVERLPALRASRNLGAGVNSRRSSASSTC